MYQTVSLIKKDNQSFIYNFDATSKKFMLTGIAKSSMKDKYFLEPGNDSLFLKAFTKELDEIEFNGSNNDKKVVKFLRKK